jgi:RNA polymerase sigma-70 factor (ECF subfamily)
VVWVITYLMGDDRQSEDLAQDVFLRVFCARDRYVPTAEFSTWLFTIVRRVVLNARRARARRRETNGFPPAAFAENPRQLTMETPLRATLQRESLAALRGAIGKLCTRQQLAVSLFYLEGEDYGHVARTLGTTQKAVKSMLHRARANLRRSVVSV